VKRENGGARGIQTSDRGWPAFGRLGRQISARKKFFARLKITFVHDISQRLDREPSSVPSFSLEASNNFKKSFAHCFYNILYLEISHATSFFQLIGYRTQAVMFQPRSGFSCICTGYLFIDP